MIERTYEVEGATLDTLAGFIDTDGPTFTAVDRSRLERYATCPAQAVIVDSGAVIASSPEADSGNGVHDAFSEATDEYVLSGGALNAGELVDIAIGKAYQSRPDIQPDVIRGLRPSVWAWAKFVNDLHPANVLRYDGGKGNRSGQLSWNIEHIGITVTAELDFLHAGPSPEVLHEIDYKSGRKHWTAADVADSFQFAVHGWLILKNYPAVECAEIRVWNTRSNSRTYKIEHRREHLPALEARIVTAAEAWRRYHGLPADEVPAYPAVGKCSICSAAKLCPVLPPESVAKDPAGFVVSMFALQTRLEAMHDEAKAYAKEHGDIEGHGVAFGINKPKKERPKSTLYLTGKDDEDAESDD